MDAEPSPHPTDRTLSSYGLGRLDRAAAEAVDEHLWRCPDCRRRVGELKSDSFLDRLRDVRKGEKDRSRGATGASIAAGSPAPATPEGTLPEGLEDHPGYRVVRELGRGGMGVVYLARNTLMDRDEVLKVIGRQVLDRPGVLDRFQREIRAVAGLQHPNIVAAYSAFRIEGGLVLAMEYVDGPDLARLVASRGPLPVAHAASFAHQAALGLQHAHERGTVHRDIKPHNLMLAREGKAGVVKVLDFGLAKAGREGSLDPALTRVGQALGTPDYMAPEQILNAPDVDIRADLYSLGGTLHFLLAGRPPFRSDSLYDLFQSHISRSADPLNLVRPEVPSELAAVVAKMMAKDPRRRFQTPAEAARALEPFFRKGSRTPPRTTTELDVPRPAPPAPPPEPPVADGDPGEPAAPSAEAPEVSEPPAEARRRRLGPSLVAVAACGLAAIGLGAAFHLRGGGSGDRAGMGAVRPLATAPKPAAPPAPTPAPAPAPVTLTFRQGADGYSGTFGMNYRGEGKGGDNEPNLWSDWPDPVNTRNRQRGSTAVLRFDGLFGPAPGRIPSGSTIVAARLRVVTGPFSQNAQGNGGRIHRLRRPVDFDDATNKFLEDVRSGRYEVVAPPTHAVGGPSSRLGPGPVELDVAADVRAWSSGEPNHGWAFLPFRNGRDGWGFRSPVCPDADNRPTLTVTFVPPAAGAGRPSAPY